MEVKSGKSDLKLKELILNATTYAKVAHAIAPFVVKTNIFCYEEHAVTSGTSRHFSMLKLRDRLRSCTRQ